jgi:hypothetical protein
MSPSKSARAAPTSSHADLEREADQVAHDWSVGRPSRVRRSAPPSAVQCAPVAWKTTSDVQVNQLAGQ